MRKTSIFLAVTTMCSSIVAATHAGFGLDAFNRAVSAAARGNAVFSPISFEIDSVIFSEAFGALTRAKFAETMGVLTGLESAYLPLHEELTKQDGRKMAFLQARAFCVPDERKVHPAYRQWMQKSFSAEAFSVGFRDGATCWFRSRMDGEMEDFELPDKAATGGHYSFFDLVSFHCAWKDPFPTNNTREMKFMLADGSSRALPAMCDLRTVDIWTQKKMTILRLPMAESAWFYALLPRNEMTVRDIRNELNSITIVNIIGGITSITEDNIRHGAAAIAIPKMDIAFETDLKLPFSYFRFPTTEMERMEKDIRPQYIRQRTRFRLTEQGLDEGAPSAGISDNVSKDSHDSVRFVLNKPFLFFVHHEPTSTIPVVGQFMGM